MTSHAASTHPRPSPAAEAGKDIDRLGINTIRTLAIDAVQKAKSGHAGAPMGFRASRLYAVAKRAPLRPGRSAVAKPRPLRAVQRPRLHDALRADPSRRREACRRHAASPMRRRSASTTSRASARSTASRPGIRNTATPPASSAPPVRSARAAATASAWRSPRAGSARAITATRCRFSTSTSTRSAATAT